MERAVASSVEVADGRHRNQVADLLQHSRVDFAHAGLQAARGAVLTLSLVVMVGALVCNGVRGRWRLKASTVQERSWIGLGKAMSSFGCLGRAQRVTWFTCSSGFIAYWTRSVLSIVIMDLSEELHLDESTTALALSSFFYGYVVSNIFSARLIKMYSGRMCMFCAILGTTVLTFSMPSCVLLGGAQGLILCRGALGLIQGTLYPSIYSVFASEFMHDEASRTKGLSFLGAMPSLGIAANFLTSPLLIKSMGWRRTVYATGFLGVPWLLLWWVSPLRREPRSMVQCAKDIESTHAGVEADAKLSNGSDRSVIYRILRTPTFYALVCAHFAHSWCTYVVMAWLPTYMRQELGVSGKSLSISCLPYIATAIAAPCLCMSASWLIQRDKDSDLWRARRCLGMAATLLPAAGMLLFPRIPISLWPLPLVVVGASLAFTTLASVSVLATPLDIAGPQTSGLLFSMSNVVASVPGFLGVQVVGELRQCCGWQTAFASCTVVYIVAAFMYARHGSASRIFD